MSLNGRMTLTVAVACVLVSVVLYPLFTTALWFAQGIGAVLVVAGTGALTRLRTLPVLACLAASLAALLLYLNLVFEARHSLLLLIPTPTSMSRLFQLIGTGMADANRYAPPVPELPSLLILAAGGIGITAALADLIAVRLRSTALAGLPLLVLFSVPVMMNAPHSQWGTTMIFCLAGSGYLAMLSADGRERIRVWGRLVSLWRYGAMGASRTAPPRRAGELAPGPDTRALAAAGRRVGLASIVLALCAPLLIPGLHPSKLLSSGPGIGGTGGSGGPGGAGIPGVLSQTITSLREKNPRLVLTYTTTAPQDLQGADPQYLQQYVFDTLADSGWAAPNYSADETQITAIPPPPGLTDQLTAQSVTTTVHASNDFPSSGTTPTFLPAPYPPTSIIAPSGIWLIDPDFMVFSGQGATIADKSYTVTSLVVDPTAAELSQAPPPSSNMSADLQLPRSYQLPELRKLAQQITASAHSQYAKADALASWLVSHGVYNTNAPGIKNAADLVTFLTKTRSGVCVQYAWAMTVLARLLGVPARMATGYTAGTLKSKNHYVVTTKDDHAWPEVYFQGYGWIRFEPTPPGQGTSTTPNYMSGATGGAYRGVGGPPIVPITGPSAGAAPGGPAGGFHNRPLGGTGPAAKPPAKPAGTPWAAVLLAVVAAIALAGGVIAVVAPPAHRALSSRAGGEPRLRRKAVTGTTVALVTAAAALVALSLYRLLSRTSGLNLGAGWAMVGIAFGAACAAMLVAPAIGRVALRRWRWMRATDDVSRAHAAWREFRDDLADLGVGYRPSEPPRSLAGRVATGLPEPARDAVLRLAMAEERACYSARPADSAALRRDGSTARRGLAARARRGARWRSRIFPVSLMTALADGAARINERLLGLRPAFARRALHPAVALLPAAPPFLHPLHQPGAPALARAPRPAGSGSGGRGGPGRLRLGARGADPCQVPPPADHRPHQGQQHDRRPGRLKVRTLGDHARHEHADADEHADQRLYQFALVVHTRIA
jgi:transglutaminase-like putative cysteine protease